MPTPRNSRANSIRDGEQSPGVAMKTTTKTGWLFSTLLSSLLALDQGWAADEKISLALPAVPPVFGGVVALVAKEEGLFKKYGLEVDVRSFDSGAAAAQAVVARHGALALSPP